MPTQAEDPPSNKSTHLLESCSRTLEQPNNSIFLRSLKILVVEQKPNNNGRQTRVAWLHFRADKLFLLAQKAQTKWMKGGQQGTNFKQQFYGKRLAELEILTLGNLRRWKSAPPLLINQEYFLILNTP